MDLPDEMVLEILNNIRDYDELVNICSVSTQFMNLCTDSFWKDKFRSEFGDAWRRYPNLTWRQRYRVEWFLSKVDRYMTDFKYSRYRVNQIPILIELYEYLVKNRALVQSSLFSQFRAAVIKKLDEFVNTDSIRELVRFRGLL